jgi:uncharacterized membrane protein YphA (DoxX/SURF4 family)
MGQSPQVQPKEEGSKMVEAVITARPEQARRWLKVKTAGLWILQLGAAAMFLKAGSAKLMGDPLMVDLFNAIGFGQWFRFLTGSLETAGAIALAIPATAVYGAVVLTFVMAGAVLTHLVLLGGNAAPAVILLAAMLIVVYGRKEQVWKKSH